MSSLVPSTPGTSSSDAVATAISNAIVSAAVNSADFPSYNLQKSSGFTPGQYIDVGKNPSSPVRLTTSDILVIGANNTASVDFNSRPSSTPPAGSTAAETRQYYQDNPTALDSYAVVAIGGSSNITFTNDTVDPSFGVDVIAGSGFNTVTLNDGPDKFTSTDGNDSVVAGLGKSTLIGGSGQDTFVGGGQTLIQASTVAGAPGDSIFSSSLTTGHDTIQAGTGADTITLLAGNNSVIGSAGKTTIFAGPGADTINDTGTTGGTQTIFGGGGSTFVDERRGSAQVTVDNRNDTVGSDTIFGNAAHPVDLYLNQTYDPSEVSKGPAGTASTTLTFSGGQVMEVKNVTVHFLNGDQKY